MLILKKGLLRVGKRRRGRDTIWCMLLYDFHDTYYSWDLAGRVIEEG